jgi:ABC-2 type transport system ATP-binding protein
MATPAIETDGLTKLYGRHPGVVGLTFSVQPGEVFGFLGPNGAGKTTTIRTLLDLIRPTDGRARIFGMDTHERSLEVRRRTGYLPGELALYDRMTGEEILTYLGHLRGGVDRVRIGELAQRLGAVLTKRVRSLSHGNKQKIGLIQAFMHRPELLLLDEPTSGLDPLVQHQTQLLIREARQEGRTVFLSSHVLPEVEALCDRVGIIKDGALVTVEQIAALKARALRRLQIHFATPPPEERFLRLPGVRDVTTAGNVLRCTVVGSLDAVIKAAGQFTVTNVVTDEPSLEEIFLAFYGGGPREAARRERDGLEITRPAIPRRGGGAGAP